MKSPHSKLYTSKEELEHKLQEYRAGIRGCGVPPEEADRRVEQFRKKIEKHYSKLIANAERRGRIKELEFINEHGRYGQGDSIISPQFVFKRLAELKKEKK